MDIENRYQSALDYLYSFVDYSLTRSLHYSPELFDLSRMIVLLDRLGNPQEKYACIHVAGTKGKGSVSVLCASALRAAGYKVGLYTSPHLSDYVERIQINGIPISHAGLVDLIDEIKPHIAAVQRLTTFEITTVLGFLYFARNQVDAAVIEVGLGGRLDATNVITPLVSVITSLSMDHMNVLGDTLPKIAFEKAGIIKPGRPVVSAPQQDEARQVIEEVAQKSGSPLTLIGKDTFYAPQTHTLDGQSILVWSASDQELVDEYIESHGNTKWVPVRLNIPLLGYHQAVNAATAYTVLQIAANSGFEISEQSIQEGFRTVKWPGRFEILRKDPPLIIDSAHNPDSALKLRLALDDYLPGRPVVMVFGASEDKDLQGMFSVLLPRIQRVIATRSVHPRAMDPDLIVRAAHQFGKPAQAVTPLEAALEESLKTAGDEAAVLATGSLFIAAAVRDTWFTLQSQKALY